jgi:hypothetical protein
MKYSGRSQLKSSGSGQRILEMAPNLARDRVAFDAALKDPLRFREAISALHDVVINDLTFKPRDKSAYEAWKVQQRQLENSIRREARERTRDELQSAGMGKPSRDLKRQYSSALKRYWQARRQLNQHLRTHNEDLWRKLMPYDPVITVADDVVFFECFSTDESSYGCLSVDRDGCFGATNDVSFGTTNVDYSWDLYHNFQSLRTYRETRFNINPDGFDLQTSDRQDYREEKIELPDGWLRGFMQLQAAMGLPMRKVSLGVDCVYSLLAFLKRNRAATSPRAIRFELADGKAPALVLEPWEKRIESPSSVYHGLADEPIRIWGRRRLLTLARLLPLATSVDVHLLGTGLPSFWVVHMGNMRLTLGLSGWTTNDWTRGSAVNTLLPSKQPGEQLVASAAETVSQQRAMTLSNLAGGLSASLSDSAAAMNQLALRGQVIFDLASSQFRWRQVLPMALSDREMGAPHPETAAAAELLHRGEVAVKSEQQAPRGGIIVTAKAGNQNCELLIDGDGMVKKGSCKCSWHYKFGIRNGLCRHLQAIRDVVWTLAQDGTDDWYEKRLKWSGRGS